MARRPDPTRIDTARREATRQRLLSTGMLRDQIDALMGAWEAVGGRRALPGRTGYGPCLWHKQEHHYLNHGNRDPRDGRPHEPWAQALQFRVVPEGSQPDRSSGPEKSRLPSHGGGGYPPDKTGRARSIHSNRPRRCAE